MNNNILVEVIKHLAGQHNQQTHGNKKRGQASLNDIDPFSKNMDDVAKIIQNWQYQQEFPSYGSMDNESMLIKRKQMEQLISRTVAGGDLSRFHPGKTTLNRVFGRVPGKDAYESGARSFFNAGSPTTPVETRDEENDIKAYWLDYDIDENVPAIDLFKVAGDDFYSEGEREVVALQPSFIVKQWPEPGEIAELGPGLRLA